MCNQSNSQTTLNNVQWRFEQNVELSFGTTLRFNFNDDGTFEAKQFYNGGSYYVRFWTGAYSYERRINKVTLSNISPTSGDTFFFQKNEYLLRAIQYIPKEGGIDLIASYESAEPTNITEVKHRFTYSLFKKMKHETFEIETDNYGYDLPNQFYRYFTVKPIPKNPNFYD